MKVNKVLRVCSLAAAMLVCSGCWALWLGGGALVGAGVAVGVTAYVEGNLEVSLDHTPVDVAKATEKAFATLGITKVSSTSSALSTETIGRTSKDEKVRVVADAAGERGSKLSIRIGVFGNEAESMRIYDEIRKNLGAPATPEKK